VPAIEHRARQARRRDRITRGGIGAGIVAVAAVAAIGVAGALAPAPAGTARASGTHPAGTRAPAVTGAPLARLAATLRDVRSRSAGHSATLLTGNNHPPEGSSQLPSAVWLRGLRVTCLNYGE
jgi:hypothetical protein